MKRQKSSTSAKRKTLRKKRDVVYVVVFVFRGIIDTVEAYRDLETAQNRTEILKQDINPDYDEIGVFEIEVGKSGD